MECEHSPGSAAWRIANTRQQRFYRHLTTFWLLLGVLLCMTTAQANSLLISQGVLLDPSGKLSIAEVAQAHFSPLQGAVMSAGYSDGAHWLRIEVRARADNRAVKLRIRPTFLDEIQLFEADPNKSGQWLKRVDGDRQLGVDSDPGINSLGFLVTPQAPSSVYFLRLQTSSTSMLHVEALPPAAAMREDAKLAIWNFFYLALLIGIVAWGIQDLAQYRQTVVGLFVLYQLSNVLYTFSLMGYLTVLIPESWVGFADRLTSLAVILVHISAIVFHKAILQPYGPARWMLYGINVFLLIALLLPLVYLAGWERQALQANVLSGLLASLFITLVPFTARQEGIPSRRYIRSLYLFMGSSQLLFLLPFLGISNAAEWTLYSTLMQGFLIALLMFYMLQQRSRLLREELEAGRLQASTAKLQLEQERTHAQSLGRFIDMLTHEIKTPLAVAVMNLSATRTTGPYMERARRALSNIDAIIERTRLSELAEHQRLQPQNSLSNISELVYECIETSTNPARIQAQVGFALEANTDAGLLTIIIANLIDNALKYAPADQPVELSLEHTPTGLLLRIRNPLGAAGMPDAEQLFSKFYRGTTAHSQSGSGLGLYLAHHLAQLLGARLDYQPHTDTVEFSLWIPV